MLLTSHVCKYVFESGFYLSLSTPHENTDAAFMRLVHINDDRFWCVWKKKWKKNRREHKQKPKFYVFVAWRKSVEKKVNNKIVIGSWVGYRVCGFYYSLSPLTLSCVRLSCIAEMDGASEVGQTFFWRFFDAFPWLSFSISFRRIFTALDLC